MSPAAAPQSVRRRELVELLASWGATADPTVAALFDALERRSGAGIASRVDALLARADVLPDPDARATLEWIREACAAGRAGEREVRARFLATAEKARADLDRALESRRAALRASMEPWIGSLGPRRAEPVLEALWAGAGQGEIEDRFAALDALGDAERRFAQARKELAVELGRVEKTEANAAALERASRALDADDPEEFARARAALQKELDRAELRSRRRELDAARDEVDAARGRLERAAAATATAPAEAAAIRALLEATADLPRPGDDAPETALDAALRTARAARAECDDLAEALAAGRPDRAPLRARLADALRARVADAPDPAAAGFYAGARAALEAAASDRARAEKDFAARAGDLSAKATELERALQDAAGEASAETLATGATALQDARATLAARDASGIDAAVAGAVAALDAIDASAEETRRRRKDRRAAQREAGRERVARLRDAAPPNARRTLESIESRLDDDPQEALRALDRLEARVGGGLRGEALQLAARADAAGDAAAAARLRDGLAGDDLPGLAREVERARGSAFQKKHRTRRLLRVAAAAALFVVLAVAIALIRTAGPGTKSYTLRFAGPETGDALAGSVALYRDGALFAETPFVPGTPVEVRLPDGRFEIYVNDRYTGRAIRVPGDAERVDDIPIPPDAPVP